MRFHALKLLHRPLIQLQCFSEVDVGCFQRFANLFLILRQRRDAKDARLELVPRNGMTRSSRPAEQVGPRACCTFAAKRRAPACRCWSLRSFQSCRPIHLGSTPAAVASMMGKKYILGLGVGRRQHSRTGGRSRRVRWVVVVLWRVCSAVRSVGCPCSWHPERTPTPTQPKCEYVNNFARLFDFLKFNVFLQ